MWRVIMEPHTEGIVILLEPDGDAPSSVFARVGWNRWTAKNKGRSFKAQLRRVIARAEHECAHLNGDDDGMPTEGRWTP